ncbi:MAG: ABC transporter ATP-binding protein [bacterium]|nr:ABC transporter ATP-binding protein [bacterium]
MTTLILEHLHKEFPPIHEDSRPVQAIEDISLRVPSGEVLVLLGPSGCGKSTLLRLVAGLISPDSGRVLFDNIPLPDIPLIERHIGMVFQSGALIPHWRAEQSVSFFYHLRHRDQEVTPRIQRIAQITGIGLEQLLERRPSQLSGGEQQRVSVARALTRDLRLLLFDEPFSNIDALLRRQARVELKRLLHEFPVTTIYVTHDQDEASALGDKIAVMREGKIVQMGTYAHLLNSPMNLFVAQFIGVPTINIFHGQARGGYWQGDNFGGYPFRTDFYDGTPITLAIRPHYFTLASDGVPCVIQNIFPYLAERFQLLEVWIGGEHWSMAFPLEMKFERGETLYCQIQPEHALYFDTETGVRVG